MRLSDEQMKQAFDMWVASMPHEGVGDPFRQIAVSRERLETSHDGIGLWRTHDLTTLWDTATWGVEHLQRELSAALARAEKAEAERDEKQRQVDALCDVTDEAIGALEPLPGCKDIADMLQNALAEARKAAEGGE
jgi:hypothetical protein